MPIQTKNSNLTGTPIQVQVVESNLLELPVKPNKLTMAQKLKAYDPAVHGDELMAEASVGAEFGAL